MEKKSKSPRKSVKKLSKNDLKAVKGGGKMLTLGEIKGESTDDKHKGEIEIHS